MDVIKLTAHFRAATAKACLFNFIFLGEDGEKYSSKKIWIPKSSVLSYSIGWVVLDDAFRFKVEKDLSEFHPNYKSLLIFKDVL